MDPDFVVVGYCNSCGRVSDYGRFRNKWRYFVNVWVACRKGSECQYNNGSQPWGMILMNVVQCISHKWYVKWGGTDERHVGLVGIYTYIYIFICTQNAHVGTTTANENAITFRWIHRNSYTNYLTALRFDLSWDVGAVCRMQAKLIGPMKRTNLCHFFVPISNHAPFTRYLRWFFCFFRMSTRFSSSKMPKFGT